MDFLEELGAFLETLANDEGLDLTAHAGAIADLREASETHALLIQDYQTGSEASAQTISELKENIAGLTKRITARDVDDVVDEAELEEDEVYDEPIGDTIDRMFKKEGDE